MARDPVVGWVVAKSKQEAVTALEIMLYNVIEQCDDDVDFVNMYITESEVEKGEA